MHHLGVPRGKVLAVVFAILAVSIFSHADEGPVNLARKYAPPASRLYVVPARYDIQPEVPIYVTRIANPAPSPVRVVRTPRGIQWIGMAMVIITLQGPKALVVRNLDASPIEGMDSLARINRVFGDPLKEGGAYDFPSFHQAKRTLVEVPLEGVRHIVQIRNWDVPEPPSYLEICRQAATSRSIVGHGYNNPLRVENDNEWP